MLENETRRLIGWLPGEPGGRAVGGGARGEPEGTPEREGNSSSNHLLSSGGQAAKPMSRSLSTSDRLSISLAYFDQAPCAYKPSARSPPRFSPCRLAAAGSRSAALLGVLRQVKRPGLCAAAESVPRRIRFHAANTTKTIATQPRTATRAAAWRSRSRRREQWSRSRRRCSSDGRRRRGYGGRQ